jgi:hypothetical protein
MRVSLDGSGDGINAAMSCSYDMDDMYPINDRVALNL